jgi:tetratricopeptide (TPR) repeat protein
MVWRGIWLACVVAACQAAAFQGGAAWGQDRVKPTAGAVVTGTVSEMTDKEVVVRKGVLTKKLAVNEIVYIIYEGEPLELTKARSEAVKGEYEAAAKELAKVESGDLRRPEVKADYEFYKALATARMALGGNGSKQDAGRLLVTFVKNHASNYHYLEACEVLGDLLVSLEKYDGGLAYYQKLEAAPWPDYKIRAGVLIGRSLQAQKKFKEAIEKFDEVLAEADNASGKDVEREAMAAKLGRATSLAGAGKADEAIKTVESVIDKAPKENQELHARAYDALGTCYRLAGKKKEALLAFLHVDLLYSSFPEQHAEALANLSTLWAEVNKGERGAQARNQLRERYPYSHWAQ